MTGPNAGVDDSPLDAVAGTDGAVVEAFTVLGNEIRLAILIALWDAYEPFATDNALSFTELRERVGVEQGRQFNYHLDKVVGRFVRKSDEGYHLRRSALLLVQSIIAGTGFEEASVEPTPIDADCPRCGGQTAVTYQNVNLYQVCTECPGTIEDTDEHPEGTLLGWTLEPTGVADRSAEELFTVSTITNFARIVQRFEGICPECSGQVEWSLDCCPDHDATADRPCETCGRQEAVLAREFCSVCKSSGYGTPAIKALFHPAVVSFFDDHGIAVGFTGSSDFHDVRRTLALVEEFETTVISPDPVRVRVSVTRDRDRLDLVLDEAMTVREVERGGHS